VAGKIIKAAVTVGGLVAIGRRHSDIILDLVRAGNRKLVKQDQQGFID